MKDSIQKITDAIKQKLPAGVNLGMFQSARERIVLDLSEGSLRFMLMREVKGQWQVVHVFVKKNPGDTDELCAEQVRLWALETKSFHANVMCVLPSRFLISRNIDMPSNDREEIAKIINLQVGRFTPYSREEIVIDYLCREMEGQHYTNVLLIIVNRSVIERFYRITEKAGLAIDKVSMASEGFAKKYLEGMPPGTQYGTAGIYIGETSTDLTIIEGKEMIFVRNLSLGAQTLMTGGDPTLTDFMTEIQKSIAAYQDEGVGRPVKKVLLSGPRELQEILKTKIIPKMQDKKYNFEEGIEIFDPKGAAVLSPEAAAEIESAGGEQPFLDLLLPAVFSSQLKVDLIPREIKLKRKVSEGAKDIVTLGIMIMSISLVLSLLLAVKIYFKNVQINQLDHLNQSSFDDARMLERVSTKTRVVRQLLELRGRGLNVFDKVTKLIGDDIYLAEFSYNNEGKLLLKGTAESMSRVFAFVTQLEESNYFSSVKTTETKTRREGKKEVADFTLECMLAEGF